jgi:hypothetical protein
MKDYGIVPKESWDCGLETGIREASKSGKNQHCSRGLTFHHEYAGLLAGRAGFRIYLFLDAIIPM